MRHNPEEKRETHPHPPFPVVDRVSNKAISSGQRINFANSDWDRFSIGDWIHTIGCESFYSISERYYHHLIYESYCTIAHGRDGWIADVRGVSIPVSKEMLSRVWEITLHGPIIDSLGDIVGGFMCILKREDIRGVLLWSPTSYRLRYDSYTIS